jgi:hypothetical protein
VNGSGREISMETIPSIEVRIFALLKKVIEFVMVDKEIAIHLVTTNFPNY